MAFAGRLVIALEDDHVAAVTATPVEIASSGSTLTNWRHHFEKLIAHREHRILQPEGCDFRIAIGDLQAEHVTNLVDDGSKVPRDQDKLPQAKPHTISSFLLEPVRMQLAFFAVHCKACAFIMSSGSVPRSPI